MEGAWQQGGLDDVPLVEHVPGVHLPGVDAGRGVVDWDVDGRGKRGDSLSGFF